MTWCLIALVVFLLYRVVELFLAPLTWAAILTIFCFPFHRWLRQRVQRSNLAAFISVSLVTVVLVAPLSWLVPAFVSEAIAVFRAVPSDQIFGRLRDLLEIYFVQIPVPLGNFEDVVRQLSQQMGTFLAQQSAQLAGDVARFVFDLVVMLLTMFYLFRDGSQLLLFLKDISPLVADHRDRMISEVTDLISVTISSGFAVAAVQGVLGGLVFWLIGMDSPVFWGVITAFLAFLPLVGPWLIWIPAGVGLLLNGQTGRGIALLVLGFFLVSGADNVLRPIMIAGRAQLNGLLVFIGVMGGIQAFGFLGVVLGPLVIATATGLLKGYRESLREQETEFRPGAVA